MSEHPTAPVPPGKPAGKRPRGFETVGDMVRSVVVVLALVLVIFFLGIRPQVEERPPVDVSGVVQQADDAGLGVTAPQLPEGWKASNVRFGPDAGEGLPTLHLGYLDPQGQYGGISVTPAATPTWVQGVVGEAGQQEGTRELAGRTWQVWTNADTRGTTLVSGAPDGTAASAAQSVAVTSRGDDAALTALAEAAAAATPQVAQTSQG